MGLQTASYFLFLGLVAMAHAWLPPSRRNLLLLVASLFFYAMSSVGFLVMLLVLSSLNYWAVLNLSRTESNSQRSCQFGIILLLDLAVLITFKYLSQPIESLLALAGWGGHLGAAVKLATPLGISYFTFQMIACATDAYRQNWKAHGGWGNFLLFGLFFPQITSGPIPRAGQLLPQLVDQAKPTAEDRLIGLRLIAYGLFKKYVVANRLEDYVAQIFDGKADLPTNEISTLPIFLACIFNVLNLYADFSSYVDIAIGSARFLGISLDPNFNRPFISTSVTEFWRRWHMTLSFWLRDYLYMPLLIRIRNLAKVAVVIAMIFTFAVCGVWHDATLPYLFFGVSQGLVLSLELITKPWRTKRLKRWPVRGLIVAGWLYTMGFFVLSEVFFRASSLANAWSIFSGLWHLRMPYNTAELFASRGPFNFALNFIAIGVWLGVAWVMRRESVMPTPMFLFVCGLLTMFLGHLGTAHFIYAGF